MGGQTGVRVRGVVCISVGVLLSGVDEFECGEGKGMRIAGKT